MLSQLFIENIAVIQKAEINFKDGFHVFTGETGAGKTILMNAINMVLGGRTYKDIIRTGETKASVSALFEDIPCFVEAVVEECGISVEDHQLLVSRDIDVSGKSQCKINGKPATTSMLREICSLLIDIHGQHDNQSLMNSDSQLVFIDSYGNYAELLEKCADLYQAYSDTKANLASLEMDDSVKLQRIDSLNYQINEIESANLKIGEDEELTVLQKKIKNSEQIAEALSLIRNKISGNDESSGILDSLSDISDSIDILNKYMEDYKDSNEKISDFYYWLEELSESARNQLEDVDYDNHKLDEIENRLDLISRLKKKYGPTIDEILKYLGKIVEEKNSFESADELFIKLKSELMNYQIQLDEISNLLSSYRVKTAEKFISNVEKELQDLNMAQVHLHADFQKIDYSRKGVDGITFMIQTNAGEEFRPLSRIASGGELSRIMLAIKNVLADKDNLGTIIFDEIDTGVSGSAAQKIGKKLKEVSNHRQIICVTHLAPVAAYGTHHYKIEKNVENGRTYTNITKLNDEERVKEIARIMIGDNITQNALQNAMDLLNNH